MSQLIPGQEPGLAIAGRIATITLRRPSVANRLELDDLATLRKLIAEVNATPEVIVLRLKAQGRHFCSGFNIGNLENGGSQAGQVFEALAGEIEAARPVTIAVLQGGVYGGGTDLALACDFRIGVRDCEMVVPAVRLGLHFYRGGMERYVARLGLATAKRILLMAEKCTADTMLSTGYLDRLVDSQEDLVSAVDHLSLSLAGMAPLALLGMKKHLNRIATGTLDAAEVARDIAAADASEDVREGALAWKERRAAVFRGR